MKKSGILIHTFILCLALQFCVFAAVQPLGNITRVIEVRPAGVVLATSSGARVSVNFFDIDAVRVRIAPAGTFERDFSYAIDYTRDRHTPRVKVAQTPKEIVLTNYAGARVVIGRTPFSIEIFDENGEAVVREDRRHPTSFDKVTGEIRTSMLRRSEVETYYGFGEKAFLEMSRNGKFIVNWNTDTFAYPIGTDPIYQSIPFFYGLYDGKAFGLFFNNTFRTWFDMGKSAPERFSFGADGGELDFYVFTGGKERSPKKVMEDYANLTGKTPLPPMWALGNQQSRWSYFPEKRVREIADGFRSNKIPADVIYLDIDYMDEYRVFTWNRERFADPRKMIADLRSQGLRTVVIIDPGIKVDPAYSVYTEGQKAGVFVKEADGRELNRDVWPKASAFPDFTDPRAREWFGSKFRQHIDEGIAGFWTDMNEPGVFVTAKTERPEILHHPEKTFPYETPHAGDGSPGTHRRYHNVYGMQMARSTFEGVRKLAPQRRPFVLTRAGFAGVQRYSAVWTGDNYASWDHLALTIPMLANLSVSGVPFVGADVGGFAEMPSGELYSRWLQAAALTPFLRSHSVGWVGNKEPWAFGDEFTRINRETIELRYRFLPYLYTLFYEHERTGQPVMRPLWYEFPKDKLTYLVSDQFMVGSDIMVAPVIREGMRTRGIYLPAGAEWIDWWTGAKLESGKIHYLQVALDRLPIFIRVGAVVPTQGVIQHTGEMDKSTITLNVAAGTKPEAKERASLFQDAGDGYDYRRNGWQQVRLTHTSGKLNIERIGDFRGQRFSALAVHGVSARPASIRLDGKPAEFRYSPERSRVEVDLSGDEKTIEFVR